MYSKSFDELEWYLRDYFFKNEKTGIYKTSVNEIDLANTLIEKYFRFRDYKPGELSKSIKPLIEKLIELNVIKNNPHEKNMIEISNIERFQCSKCYFICYLSEFEKLMCFRCESIDLKLFKAK